MFLVCKMSFFFVLKVIKKKICNLLDFLLAIVNSKIILKKILSLINVFKTWTFYIYKIIKVDIINKNKNFIFVSF